MADQEVIRHQQTLLKINRSRLKVLLEQQTTMGLYTPPHVQLEIDGTRGQICNINGIAASSIHHDRSTTNNTSTDSLPSREEVRHRR
jgi:hypothetical protein